MTRSIWLCADDYGLAPGVNASIRDLIGRGRLNATSVMVVAPSCDAAAAQELLALNAPTPRAATGLHFTLTGPFLPISENYRPLKAGHFFGVSRTLLKAWRRRLDPAVLAREADAQILRFIDLFGRPPDFVDGHQHVHLFPMVREAVIAATRRHAPNAWLRQCGNPDRSPPIADPKGVLIDRLSRRFRDLAHAQGIPVNPAFAGTYTYSARADFGALLPRFLDGLPSGAVVMCHPGTLDAELVRLDPLTDLREREYAFLKSDAFAALLAKTGVSLN